MKYLDDMMELADKEFEVFSKNGKFRSREEIDTAYKLVDIIKDIYCIWKYEEEGGSSEEGSYESYEGRSNRSNRGSYGGSYDGSYARGRGARRDSMGRYSRDGGKEEYMNQLRSMAEAAPDEKTRSAVSRMVREMERD